MASTAERTDLIDTFEEFYRKYYRDEIGELARGYPTDEKSLWIDWQDLYRFDPDLADDLRNQPGQILDYAEEALRLYDLPVDVSLGQAHVRVRNLPDTVPIGDIRSDLRGHLIAVQGAIREMTPVEPKVTEAAFECQRCGTLTRIPQLSADLQEPHECQGCERQGPFLINEDQSEFVDVQKVRVQELPGTYGESDTPPRITVHLEADLAGTVSAGDRVTATGILELEQQGTDRNPTATFDRYLKGVAIEDTYDAYPEVDIVEQDEVDINDLSQEEDLFEQFVGSLAPSVKGLELLKQAIVLQLFGGVPKKFPDGGRARGNIHTLVVADPGIPVTRLINRSSRFAPRTVSVSGTTTSEAALTAPATASSNAPGGDPWEIKAGVAVMADRGLLTLDGIEELSDGARAALGSVLEHQEVKASKASQKKTFPARASVLAAGGPIYGSFDEFEPVAEQIGLGSKLVSNFDLIFASSDTTENDEETAEHALDLAQAAEQESPSSGIIEEADIDGSGNIAEFEPPIDEAVFRKYIVYAREHCHPTFTEEAKDSLREFYIELRSKGDDLGAPVPVSARKLESMVRLAEASARSRLSSTIDEQDVERVTKIAEASLSTIGADSDAGEFDADVVETGTSKEQRERIENLRDLIEEIEREYDEGAPIDVVIERAEEMGIHQEKTEHEIQQLKQKGEVYEPRTDHLRTT